MRGQDLQSRIGGKVTTATDAGYEQLRRAMNWNQLTPRRYPQLIVQVATEADVVEAVRFARTHGLKIAVRGRGHSCIGVALRDESLLIDLGRRTLPIGSSERLSPERRSRLQLQQLGARLLQPPSRYSGHRRWQYGRRQSRTTR